MIVEGVNILNQFEVVTKTVFSWESFWDGVPVGVIIGFIAAVIFGLKAGDWAAFFVFLGVYCTGLALLLGIAAGFVLKPQPVEYETQYEVSIDEHVNMQEFIDKYEILEIRGSIYTVKEK